MIQFESIIAGSTSVLVRLFVANSSVTTGAGLTGTTAGTSGLIGYYVRDGDTGSTQITFTTSTLGTWVSGGFVEADQTHMPGIYEIGLPNAVLATTSAKATVYLSGVTNMQDTVLFLDKPTGDAYAALATNTYAQPAAVIPATATLVQKIGWIAALARNKITTTAAVQTLFADDNSTTVSTATVTDDGTTATRGKFT